MKSTSLFKLEDNELEIKEKKIKIVAIAKDEGAYLADWIHHHLYFGFDAIHIYVNRTTDKSYEILREINRNHPNVTYESADWIDQTGEEVAARLQIICYSLALNEARKNKDCTHLFLIDIDEFWTPIDFNSSIKTCLDELNNPDSISFEWLIQRAEEIPFSALPKKLDYTMHSLVKTLFKVDKSIKRMRVHKPIFNEKINQVLANGETLQSDDNNLHQSIIPSQSSLKKYTVIHRMFRSEQEYIAALFRGNPEKNTLIKLNRQHGYLKKSHDSLEKSLPNNEHQKYLLHREKFYRINLVDVYIDECQKKIIDNIENTIRIIPLSLIEDEKSTLKVLKGLSSAKVQEKIGKTLPIIREAEKKSKQCKNADELRDFAIDHEKAKDYISAYYLMKKAKEIRPNGPIINKKLSEYKVEIIKKALPQP